MSRPVPSSATVSTVGDILTLVVVPAGATGATVQLDGDFDLLCAVGVAQMLRDQLSAGHRFVTVDLSRLTFVNSAGLRVLAVAHQKFASAGGRLVLAGVTSRLARLLDITGLDQTLTVVEGAAARHLVSVDAGASFRG